MVFLCFGSFSSRIIVPNLEPMPFEGFERTRRYSQPINALLLHFAHSFDVEKPVRVPII